MAPSSSASTLSSSGASSNTTSSAAMLLPPLSGTSSPASPLGADELRHDCGYCANGKTLREILPPKKCDYCFKFKCQFCTLRFPLIKVRKGLPKAMKGNSRICLHCFHQMWTDHAAVASGSASAHSGSEAGPLSRRASLGSRRRSASGSHMAAAPAWGEDDDVTAYDEASLRASFVADNDATLAAIEEAPSKASSVAPPSASQRAARALGLVIRSDTPKPQDVVHVVDLWLSLFAAATLLVVVLVEHLTLQQRIAFCVVIYGGFLAVHPWIHNVTVASSRTSTPPPLTRRRSSAASTRKSMGERGSVMTIAPSTSVPEVFRPTLIKMQERFARYVSDPSQWKLVKTTTGGKIYEIPNELPQALIMMDMFVPGISIADFLGYLNRTDLKDRAVWDWNVGAFEILDEYPDDDTCLVYNAQKAFMGGFVSARDFCLLYKCTPTSTIYASIEHPKVPERPNATRGIVLLAGLQCTPSESRGEEGFQLQYMVQVDIGGNIPTRLMYNGQVDNMDKMIKSFRQAHKLFTKRPTK